MRESRATRGPGAADPRPRLLGLLPPLLAAVLYQPITGSTFLADDLLHLYQMANQGLAEYVLTPFAGHVLPSWKALFALLVRLLGPEPAGFYWIVWGNHLANAWLLFEAIRWLAGSARLACLGASVWGIAPIHAGMLGWYSIHGHVLATTGVLWILRDLARLARGAPVAPLAPGRWALLTLLAATSFGVGLAAALALPAVAFLIVPAERGGRRATRHLAGIALLAVLAYAGLGWLAGALYGAPSELPVLRLLFPGWFLFGHVLEIAHGLVARGAASLLLGVLGEGLGPRGAGLQASLAAALLVLAAALGLAEPAARRGIAAALGLALACYASIAAARGILTPFIRLENLVDEPRYQYLATAALALALSLAAGALAARLPLPARSRAPLLALALAGQVTLVAWLRPPIDRHEALRREIEGIVAEIRRQIEAAPPGADVFLQNPPVQPAAAGPVLAGFRDWFPGWAAVFVIYFPENEVAGRRVFFVERDLDVRLAVARGRRTATLVVPDRRPPPELRPPRRDPFRRAGSRRRP